jgi:hypothetical protein
MTNLELDDNNLVPEEELSKRIIEFLTVKNQT